MKLRILADRFQERLSKLFRKSRTPSSIDGLIALFVIVRQFGYVGLVLLYLNMKSFTYGAAVPLGATIIWLILIGITSLLLNNSICLVCGQPANQTGLTWLPVFQWHKCGSPNGRS